MLFLAEGFFALMGYPVVIDILLGKRQFSDMPNNSNVPPWALPVGYAVGGVLFVVIMIIFVMDMYQSYRAFKLRRAEKRSAAERVSQASDLPTNE